MEPALIIHFSRSILLSDEAHLESFPEILTESPSS